MSKGNGSSKEQVQQSAKNASTSNKNADQKSYDKKLDGPNRPSI